MTTPLSPADRAREILGLGWRVEGVTEEVTFDQFELVSAIERAIAEAVEERDRYIERINKENAYLSKKHMEDPLMCGICGKTQHEVSKMIAGTFAQICGDCALVASEIVVTEAVEGERKRCADYLMEQARSLAERARSNSPAKGELLAMAGFVESLASDFRSQS